jgi:CxxC motif-containing protein (DUF1111 family)
MTWKPTAAVVLAAVLAGCGDGAAPVIENFDRRLAGGDTTVFAATSNAFATPAPNLGEEELALHMAGDAAFDVSFVTSPAIIHGGLGPVFNDKSCVGCHPRDGRGRPPENGKAIEAMLLKASVGNHPVLGPTAVPGYGTQLQHRAIFGIDPEVRVVVSYTEQEVDLSGGESATLRKPTFTIESSYASLPSDVELSPRIGPPVFGRGLLEAIPERDILRLADERDRDEDGISGRPNYVRDAARDALALGRFGLKAGHPTLLQQTAGAYVEDMGITNRVFPDESSYGQPQHDPNADDPELADDQLDAATFYIRTLAVPARRDVDDPAVVAGETLFADIGCASCHSPLFRTGDAHGLAPDGQPLAALANQIIQPFTDLLLHDMGEGLEDGRGEFEASGREWKTPALWGIGLTRVVDGHTFFLHDGRARNLTEAILWHGGEAEAARERFRTMDPTDRAALLRFLDSL